ncbi:MAG: class I SAM-dependent methyltransferase [Oligoflexia bacterium]|nr:class I SAM-dependent methyltransferase [Oligoflexia bacterium]
MKNIVLSKEGCLKVKRRINRLHEKDCLDLAKNYLPGEWVILVNAKEKLNYLGLINLRAEKNCPIIHLLNLNIQDFNAYLNTEEVEIATKYINDYISLAIDKRSFYRNMGDNLRLIYGESDYLPGLIVDKYEKYILLQINTAGIDRFRDVVLNSLKTKFPNDKIVIHDDENERKLEGLPKLTTENEQTIYSEQKEKVDKVKLIENGLHLEISADKIQKIGYYYDHRLNRHRFENLIINTNKTYNLGLDLFSYVGSWGLHLLRAKVNFVRFIDQGDFKQDIENNIILNNFANNRGEFIRSSVFDYLDQQLEENALYDVIVSDPPAFAKSAKNKERALSGYSKLHEKILKILNKNSLMAICSCTNSVSFEELDATVSEASRKASRHVNLIDIGLAGFDHPIASLQDRSNYLKYLAYYVE